MMSLTLLNSGVERVDRSALYVEDNITSNTIHTQDRLTIRSGQLMISTSAGSHLVRTRAEKVGGVSTRAQSLTVECRSNVHVHDTCTCNS